MSKNTYKSAAVPFVNQKGERSMKKVKVERYVAGKKPAYAQDEDDEYYTTDDEEEVEDEVSDEERPQESDEADDQERSRESRRKIKLESKHTEHEDTYPGQTDKWVPGTVDAPNSDEDDDDEDDDPRLRMLKQVESKASSSRMLANQINTLNSRTIQNFEDRNVVIDEDEEEDEEDVKMRHTLARNRALDEPIGPQIMLDEYADKQLVAKQVEYEANRLKKEETEDILKDLKLTGIKPKNKKEIDDLKTQENLKEMIEHARQEATLKAQLHKKIEEDNKRELEKEALDKGGIGAYDMEAVKTDDEDEELAYEEWKLREYNRVLREKKERLLEAKAK